MVELAKRTFQEWGEDKVPVFAAALAYYTVFSLAPLMIIVIAILSLFFSQGQAQAQLIGQIQGLFGEQVASAVTTMIDARQQSGGNVLASIIGFVILLVGATGVFVQLQNALNHIWDVEPSADSSGFMQLIRARLLSLGMVLIIGFLLLVSLVINTLLSALDGMLSNLVGDSGVLLQILNSVISFGVIAAVFALMFKYVPDAKIRWRDVWVGGAVTALLFVVGKFLIGLYLGNSGVASSYGAAGSLVVLLLWVFYSAQIVLLGGEFTQVFAKRYGEAIQAESYAKIKS
jgi:membrane protein